MSKKVKEHRAIVETASREGLIAEAGDLMSRLMWFSDPSRVTCLISDEHTEASKCAKRLGDVHARLAEHGLDLSPMKKRPRRGCCPKGRNIPSLECGLVPKKP